MVVVGGARQQSDGKSGKRAILLFQVSLDITTTQFTSRSSIQSQLLSATRAFEFAGGFVCGIGGWGEH